MRQVTFYVILAYGATLHEAFGVVLYGLLHEVFGVVPLDTTSTGILCCGERQALTNLVIRSEEVLPHHGPQARIYYHGTWLMAPIRRTRRATSAPFDGICLLLQTYKSK